MKKGLLALFAAVTLCGSAFAAAPIIAPLPDITVGDQEDNGVGTDNNFFVFTNAFKFDDFVSDPDQPDKSQLLWSFDEGDPAQHWYSVNGIQSVHTGDADMANDVTGANAAHLNPANSLRTGNEFATFRDIVFSPGTGPLTSSFPAPTQDHSMGKVVQFFVSDTTTVTASNKILVKTIDNGFDGVSAPTGFTPRITESATTATTWIYSGNAASSVMGLGMGSDWDQTAQALRLRAYSATTYNGDVRHRIGGWYALEAPDVMLYNTIGADKIARAKFYIYATGQATPAQKNQIPAFQLRLSTGYQVTSNLEVTPHLNATPGDQPRYLELAPSTNAAAPSIYRVDHDPIESSYLTANGNNVALATRPAFSIQALDPQDNGYIGMAECVLGTYPAAVLADNTPIKVYDTADLNPAVAETQIGYNVNPGTVDGSNGTVEFTGSIPTITWSSGAGVTHASTVVPTNRIGVTNHYFSANRNGALSNAQIARVNSGKQYKITFTVTSSQQSNRQSAFWLYARSVAFGYAQKLEFAGARTMPAYSDPDNAYGHQILPGTADEITDNKYSVLMYTPMSADIGPQPLLNAEPGFGSTLGSYRDIGTAMFQIDGFNAATPGGETEVGNITLSRVEIREYDAVAD